MSYVYFCFSQQSNFLLVNAVCSSLHANAEGSEPLELSASISEYLESDFVGSWSVINLDFVDFFVDCFSIFVDIDLRGGAIYALISLTAVIVNEHIVLLGCGLKLLFFGLLFDEVIYWALLQLLWFTSLCRFGGFAASFFIIKRPEVFDSHDFIEFLDALVLQQYHLDVVVFLFVGEEVGCFLKLYESMENHLNDSMRLLGKWILEHTEVYDQLILAQWQVGLDPGTILECLGVVAQV